MAEDAEALRVLMAEFRGEMRTSLAELRGDMRVIHQKSDALAVKVDGLESQVKQVADAQSGFVTKKEVDRRLRNGTALAGVLLTALTLLINTLPMGN